MNINEQIAKVLGYKPPQQNLIGQYYAVRRCDIGRVGINIDHYKNKDTEEIISCDEMLRNIEWHKDNVGIPHLPDWEHDKNLWVEGSEVVEYIKKNNLTVLFDNKLDECFIQYEKDSWVLFLPASDYAKAFLEVVG